MLTARAIGEFATDFSPVVPLRGGFSVLTTQSTDAIVLQIIKWRQTWPIHRADGE